MWFRNPVTSQRKRKRRKGGMVLRWVQIKRINPGMQFWKLCLLPKPKQRMQKPNACLRFYELIPNTWMRKMSFEEYLVRRWWSRLRKVIKLAVLDKYEGDDTEAEVMLVERLFLSLPRTIGIAGMALCPWNFWKQGMDSTTLGKHHSQLLGCGVFCFLFSRLLFCWSFVIVICR